MSRSSRTIYVGNLPGDIRESEIEDLFYKYGRIVDIDLKLPPRPPGYCFIEFEDPRDAEDAIRGRDGYSFDGNRLRVEFAHSGRGPPAYERFSSHRSSGGGRGASRRSEYRVIVTGLPSSASWQDLKDHMRTAGEVCFAQVFRESNGTRGIVDFTNYDDMKNAIRKLDDTEFRNPFAHSYIRVREDKSSKKSASRSRSRSRSWRSRSRSRSNSRSVSRSRSPARRSRSRSRSRSPVRESRSRSRSRSPVRESRSRSRSRSPVRHSKSKSASPSPSRSRSKSPPAKRISRSRSRSASPLDAANGRATSASPRPSRSPASPKPDDRDKSPAARSPSPVSDGP